MIRILAALCACLVLTGCASLLEREYVSVEPHSSKFWESEAAGTLRAESYQDIVNDVLLLIGRHTETASLRLYNFQSDLEVTETLDAAAAEVQQETPLGAYAVSYITSSSQSQRGYYEVSLQIGYRRSAEQLQAVVNATSTEALPTLLDTALDEGRTELAVRIGYWGEDSAERVAAIVTDLRAQRGLTDTPDWVLSFYPPNGPVGLIEFLLAPEAEPDDSAASSNADVSDTASAEDVPAPVSTGTR